MRNVDAMSIFAGYSGNQTIWVERVMSCHFIFKGFDSCCVWQADSHSVGRKREEQQRLQRVMHGCLADIRIKATERMEPEFSDCFFCRSFYHIMKWLEPAQNGHTRMCIMEVLFEIEFKEEWMLFMLYLYLNMKIFKMLHVKDVFSSSVLLEVLSSFLRSPMRCALYRLQLPVHSTLLLGEVVYEIISNCFSDLGIAIWANFLNGEQAWDFSCSALHSHSLTLHTSWTSM